MLQPVLGNTVKERICVNTSHTFSHSIATRKGSKSFRAEPNAVVPPNYHTLGRQLCATEMERKP